MTVTAELKRSAPTRVRLSKGGFSEDENAQDAAEGQGDGVAVSGAKRSGCIGCITHSAQ